MSQEVPLLSVITVEQFASVYNDLTLPNLAEVRKKLGSISQMHVGTGKYYVALRAIRAAHPGLLIDRQHKMVSKTRQTQLGVEPPISDELEHRLILENKALYSKIRELEESQRQDASFNMLWNGLINTPQTPPKWLTPKRTAKHAAIPTAMLSDTHFDEVVHAEEINNVNAYDRHVAELRLTKFGDSVVRLSRDYLGTAFDMPYLVMPWGGDMVGGNIHEELKVTNADAIMGTVHHWIGQLIGLVEMLHGHFKQIYIPCVVGNHGRNSRKPIAKGRVRDNFDWLLYKQVEFYFKGTEAQRKKFNGVTFDISNGTECRYQVYNTRYQLTHGDQFRGGMGWGGVAVPIMKGHHKKKERETATRSPFDIMLLGHFHQLLDLGNTVVNGSLKGYDEYAALNNFAFEEARQAYFLTDSKYGKTIFSPIHVRSSREPGSDHEPRKVV